MGVLLVSDEPEESVLSVRLTNAQQDAEALVKMLERAYSEAMATGKPELGWSIELLLSQAEHLGRKLKEVKERA